MHFTDVVLTALSLTTFAIAAPLNTSREFQLITKLKHGQPEKARFNDLYIFSYHTGAGLGDACFSSTPDSPAFLNKTDVLGKGDHGQRTYPLEFDLGNDFPWALSIADVNFYSHWEPVRINVGNEPGIGAFYLNETGLQWTTTPDAPHAPGFGGWLVCNWWHDVPQLFARWSYYNQAAPLNCADVYLMPEYI